jgi:hypothetical protein
MRVFSNNDWDEGPQGGASPAAKDSPQLYHGALHHRGTALMVLNRKKDAQGLH